MRTAAQPGDDARGHMRGVVNDALGIYFLDSTLASAFVARCHAGYKSGLPKGLPRARERARAKNYCASAGRRKREWRWAPILASCNLRRCL